MFGERIIFVDGRGHGAVNEEEKYVIRNVGNAWWQPVKHSQWSKIHIVYHASSHHVILLTETHYRVFLLRNALSATTLRFQAAIINTMELNMKMEMVKDIKATLKTK